MEEDGMKIRQDRAPPPGTFEASRVKRVSSRECGRKTGTGRRDADTAPAVTAPAEIGASVTTASKLACFGSGCLGRGCSGTRSQTTPTPYSSRPWSWSLSSRRPSASHGRRVIRHPGTASRCDTRMGRCSFFRVDESSSLQTTLLPSLWMTIYGRRPHKCQCHSHSNLRLKHDGNGGSSPL